MAFIASGHAYKYACMYRGLASLDLPGYIHAYMNIRTWNGKNLNFAEMALRFNVVYLMLVSGLIWGMNVRRAFSSSRSASYRIIWEFFPSLGWYASPFSLPLVGSSLPSSHTRSYHAACLSYGPAHSGLQTQPAILTPSCITHNLLS